MLLVFLLCKADVQLLKNVKKVNCSCIVSVKLLIEKEYKGKLLHMVKWIKMQINKPQKKYQHKLWTYKEIYKKLQVNNFIKFIFLLAILYI